MKIAIIGSGISGMLSAYLLCRKHDVTVFEADSRIGGHTNTIDVEHEGKTYAIDTGFIVFNDWTYPNFIKLLGKLGVETQPSPMSFSVRCEKTGLEYCGSSINSLFAQRANLFRPWFHRMLLDIVRFNIEARFYLRHGDTRSRMSDFLAVNRYSTAFIEQYLVPMMAAIWSASPYQVHDFPTRHFLQFFENHGLLNIANRPQWRVVCGGSKQYAEKLTAPYRDRIRLSSPIESIRRGPDGVDVKPVGGEAERFDEAVIAAHSDEALRMLDDPTPQEREILGALPYQENEAILHTDASVLPKRKLAWASWNYHIPANAEPKVPLTYAMNILQSLDAPVQFCVTLNQAEGIDPAKIIRRIRYHHPVYDEGAIQAQRRHGEISGKNRTHYCGAYWGYGFHEDGVKSALAACRPFGEEL